MKVLYVAHKTPYPVLDGGCFAMKQFIEVLADSVIADAFILETHKHPITENSKKYLEPRFDSVYSDYIQTKPTFKGLIKSLFSAESYLLSRFRSQKLDSFLKQKAKEYDFVICDSLFALNACKSILGTSAKVVVRSHNVEHEVWQTITQSAKGLKRIAFRILTKQLRKAEIKLLKQVDHNFAISSADLQAFKRISPKSNNILFPIHLAPTHSSSNYEAASCFFLGALNWKPNIETVDFLLESWNQNELKNIPLHIAGSFSEEFKQKQLPESVQFRGKVKSAEEFISSNGILVAPILSGGGIKVKILEAMSCGAPCITTKLGAQGINSEEAGIILVETKEELKTAVLKLCASRKLREQLGQKGKVYIQKYHSFAACKELISVNLGR